MIPCAMAVRGRTNLSETLYYQRASSFAGAAEMLNRSIPDQSVHRDADFAFRAFLYNDIIVVASSCEAVLWQTAAS